MSCSGFNFSFLKSACAFFGLTLLSGCVTYTPLAMEVSSPPQPRNGTAPIAAYDAYARALYYQPETETRIPIVATDDVEKSRHLIGEKSTLIAEASVPN